MAALLTAARAAESPTVQASIAPAQVMPGEPVQYTLEAPGSLPPETRLASLNFEQAGFQVLGGPMQQSSVSVVNQQTTQKFSYTWTLKAPPQAGNYSIGAARLLLPDGRTLVSNAASVVVQTPPPLPSSFDGVISPQTGNPEIDRQLKGGLFLHGSADKQKAYVGEQITVRYELYQAGDLGVLQYGFDRQANPYPGFMAHALYQLSERSTLRFREQNVNGRMFRVAPVETTALFATKSGTFQIEPSVQMYTLVGQRRRRTFGDPMFDRFFDDPFFDSPFDRRPRVPLRAAPIEIEILPLPTEGRPADFSDTVGAFQMAASFDRTQARQHDLVTLKVQFNGTGQVETISPPRLPEVPGLTLHQEPQIEAQPAHTAEGIGGRKTFEYIFRAAQAGAIDFPAVEYVIFNPKAGRYERLRTEPVRLTVQASAAAEQPVVSRFPTTTATADAKTGDPSVVALTRDIEYIHTDGFLRDGWRVEPLYERPVFLMFQAAPIGLIAGSFLIRRRRLRLEGDVAGARRRSARSLASRRLRGARKPLAAGESERFFEELDRALRQFVADHANESPAGLTTGRIAEALAARGVPAEDVAGIVALLEQCESARYAKMRPDAAAMRDAYDRAAQLIDRLARSLK